MKARDAMFEFLRALDLDPIEFEEAVALTGQASPFIGDALERAFREAQAAVVLITGDDVGRLGTRYQQQGEPQHETALTPQARQNVIFEAGMAMGKYSSRTVLVQLGHTRPLSDLLGRHLVVMSNAPQKRHMLASRLKGAHCLVKMEGRTDWYTAGDFDAAIADPDVDTRGDDAATGASTDARSAGTAGTYRTPKPTVTLKYGTDPSFSILKGFTYENHGPGPAFHVMAGPLHHNGYAITFDEVPLLAEGEESHRFVAHVQSDGTAPDVRGDDIATGLGDAPALVSVRFEDAAKQPHEETYEIQCDLIGRIRVARTRGSNNGPSGQSGAA